MTTDMKATIRGIDCHVNTWNYDKKMSNKPIGLVVMYHGFLAHSNYPTVRYAAEFLAAADYTVVAIDFVGHGKSPGLRGYLQSADMTIDDGVAMAKYAQSLFSAEEKQPPLFLVGSSMGGAIALSVAERLGQDTVAGAVLLAPMLKLNVSGIEHGLLSCLSYILPTMPLIPSSATSADKQYRDPKKREECENDPLTVSGAKLRTGSALTCVDIALNIGEKFGAITCPFLLMVADEDVVVKNQGSEDLFERSPSKDKAKKNYKALHGLLCEPAPLFDEIKSDMLSWMEARAKV